MARPVLEAHGIAKAFSIPSVRRETVREHALDLFRRRATERLHVLRDVSFALRHYSSGMAARLAYAVAFRAVRDVLILDEIFAVGDAEFKERCQKRYQELHRSGRAMLLVSHDPRTIAAFCDRALLLEGGRI